MVQITNLLVAIGAIPLRTVVQVVRSVAPVGLESESIRVGSGVARLVPAVSILL